MNNSTAAPEPGLYDIIRDAGVIPVVVILSGIKAFIGLIGIVFNLSLVYVTVKNKSLHGPCNVLIALNALCMAIYELSFEISMYVVATGINLITVMECFFWQFIPAFMKYFTLCLMLVIGLDRLICLLFPFWNKNKFYLMYLSFMVGVCALIGVYCIYISVRADLKMANGEVMCTVSDVSQQGSSETVFLIAFILNVATIICYAFFAVAMMRTSKKNRSSNVKFTRSIFKSLMLIMIVDVLGWGSNTVFQYWFHLFDTWKFGALEKWCISTVNGYLLSLATTAEAPILYFCSKEYRKAYHRQFQAIDAHLRPNRTRDLTTVKTGTSANASQTKPSTTT
ncbi:serpentine type 7TM GPCR chemoreceptor srsx domain-containing protein [Ditylenchus destructor]|uniref:Serpentine type 7TM GPCR chemoreceptor srsx domain-containing protein n=1 Tax=Ditylenchus destructor TaxID=166010 RepID=A0AAD4R8Y4_9BILA|nr:serpentine type 7TM GPCR chemoreceptor srsx domain-containing protein [Ditylenchus destructor]